MRIVYKYFLPPDKNIFMCAPFELQMPKDAKCLHIDVQRGKPAIWVQVNKENPIVYRHFILIGTGWELPKQYFETHVGSFLIDEQCWHLYDLGEQE